jgi:hypothetical protein
MKIKIGKYPSRLTSTMYEKHMNNKYGFNQWPDKGDFADYYMEAVDKLYQDVYNFFNRIWFDRRKQKVSVTIDPQDTWSMDSTLSHIILPMLIQLKETKHGSPHVDDVDVPKRLKSTSAKAIENANDTDEFHHDRWEYVLDEMIWAFEQKCRDDWLEDYYDYGEDETGAFGLRLIRADEKGRKAHQKRMSNGFKLFGKYYEGLWD